MAKQITPQGYTYGSDPKSHHPFWEEVEVVEPLEIIPTEEEQVITAPEGVIGYNPITVKPAAAEPFLGTLNVTPTTVDQFIDAKDYEVDGWNIVDVAPVTADIDPDIDPYNIIKGINILGVEGKVPFNITEGSRVIIIGIQPEKIHVLAEAVDTKFVVALTKRDGSNGVIETFSMLGERRDSVTWSTNPSAEQITFRTGEPGNINMRFSFGGKRPTLTLTADDWQYIYEDMIDRGFVAVRVESDNWVPPTYNYVVLASIPDDEKEWGIDVIGYLAR